MSYKENNGINYSIIIPHYNIPDLLGRCLRSIPERRDIQVIVVDDNSNNNENYYSIVPELQRDNVEFYVTYDGLGAGHARNIGLSHALGKWIIFADSDDFFSTGFSDILDHYIDNPSDVIYFNVKKCECYNTSNILENSVDTLFKTYEDTGDDRYFRLGYLEPWGKFYKHQFLKENAIDFQEVKANNDLLFSIKVGVMAHSISIVNKVLYWYVIREGSLFHQKSESFEKISDRVRAWNASQLFLDSNGIKTSFYLPVLPCIKLFKNDWAMLLKILSFMKSEKIKYLNVVYEIIRHYVVKIVTGKGTVGVVRLFKGSVL